MKAREYVHSRLAGPRSLDKVSNTMYSLYVGYLPACPGESCGPAVLRYTEMGSGIGKVDQTTWGDPSPIGTRNLMTT